MCNIKEIDHCTLNDLTETLLTEQNVLLVASSGLLREKNICIITIRVFFH